VLLATICVADNKPLLGARGFAGAHATIGPGTGPETVHWITNGWVVKVYCWGGRSMLQNAGSGLTVVGGAENVPVATN
jgi:uncharacterized protein YraI